MVSGDGAVSAEVVVDALLQPDGAASAALEAESVARVRHELQRLPRWQQALAAATAAPRDAAARAALTGAVDEVLGFNSALAQSLRLTDAAAAAAPAAPSAAAVPGGGAPSFEKAPPPTLIATPAVPAAPAAPPAPPAPPSAAPFAPPSAAPSAPPSAAPFAAPAAPGLPPAPPAAPPGAPAAPVYPALPTGAPVDPAVLAKRKRIALGVGAVVVVGGLILLGSTVFGGGGAPHLPGSVEGEKLRASSAKGDYPDWNDMNASMTKLGVQDIQGAVYGEVPEAEADSPFGGSDREARWNVVIGKPGPGFQQWVAQMASSADESDAPHVVESSLDGTMYCDSYDPDDSARTRARKEITCVWSDSDHLIVVIGTGVDENLPPKVLERIHRGSEH
ncbi:hypothetical protein Kpho02_73230 [Kitasatospora phosalacinea]|uniref:Uncharacterized protein n=1 Tax=Kitasatospora phosalacinea TaxID=2065 RepID=A0A9W6QG73_9ACTN|nr:hypothetical protein [Kitasatospora phosalacinea]GLW75026.1 hypothetical protein Kpho02_73230 [Kitasatospora phosalacinea]